MPIGGSDIGWDNSSPADTESAGLGDDRIRSMKSSIQQAMDAEHNFSSGGGANTGYHRLGSARPYYGTQSIVSSSGSDARLMLTSDTSRLFHVGSAGTSLLGGPTVISAGSYPGTPPQRHYWAQEFGTGITSASGTTLATIPNSGYSGAPYVFVTPRQASAVMMPAYGITATVFVVDSYDQAGVALGNVNFQWMSIGTRVL